jgi:oligopeptide/dipeptide ABC transporter ATP-binding protein
MVLGGVVPRPLNPPAGCVVHPRCPLAIDDCKRGVPELREIRPEHRVACIRAPLPA